MFVHNLVHTERPFLHYLIRINKTYYFRLRVPLDVKIYFHRREIKKTLNTSCYTSAKSLVKKFIAESERVFTMIRSGVLSEVMIKKMVDTFVDSRVKLCEMVRSKEVVFDDPEKQKSANLQNEFLDRVLPDRSKRKAYSAFSDLLTQTLQLDLSLRKSNQLDFITENVDSFLDENKIEIDKTSHEYTKVCSELLKGAIRASKIIKEHELGNYETDYDIEYRNRKKYLTLSQLIDQYERDKNPSWTDPTRFQSIHRQILHILGNISINDIDRNTSIKLREALREYPRKVKQEDMVVPWEELALKNKNG